MSHKRIPGYVSGMTPAVRRRRIVLQQQNGRCLECARPLVDLRTLKEQPGIEIISFNSRSVRWIDSNGERQESLIATVDHVISKKQWAMEQRPGSPHQIENLVVLCCDCHRAKTSRDDTLDRKRIEGVCYKCQGPCEPHRKKCIRCRTGTKHPIREIILREYDSRVESERFSSN